MVHLEMHTPDLAGASAFYVELLGWRLETVVTDGWPYVSLDAGLSAGVVQCGATHPVWIPYVQVRDVDAATDHALALGASPLLAPRTGPQGRRSVVRSGHAGDLALWQPS